MIPLALITGFLGSGKTTLLKHIIERERGRKLAYLVNEFSDVNVDGRILATENERVISLPGGSIFCRCLVTTFINQLRQIAEQYHQSTSPLDGLVIEASGIADPKVTTQMLAETRLDRVYQLRTIITVIDPGSFLPLLQTLPNITAQVEAGTLVIINKIDCFTTDLADEVEQSIRQINPDTIIVRAQFCETNIDPFAFHPLPPVTGQYAPCADPHYARQCLIFDHPVNLASLVGLLRETAQTMYRAKGFIKTTEGWRYVDVSSAGVNVAIAPEPQTRSEFILIFDPRNRDLIDALRENLSRA